MVDLERRLRQEVLLCIQYLVDVDFQILAELGRQLVDASDQRVAESLIDLA